MPALLRTLGHRGGIVRHTRLPPGGDRLRAHVFKIGQHGVVVKQNPAEAGVSGQIFVDVGDLLANPGIPGDRRTYGWRASNAFPVCGSQR